jgi:hypothetical protein
MICRSRKQFVSGWLRIDTREQGAGCPDPFPTCICGSLTTHRSASLAQ